ncbi:MAG TPA: hypothetical protein VFH50_12075 [Acidimicrobiales bacterium]|nr:hypothetical protein [Acidimicrobiales bacterium]
MGVATLEQGGAAIGTDGAVSLPLFVGFTIVATGGPLALVALNVPGVVATRRSMGLVVVLAVAAFAVPLAVWYRYSERIVSAGGLYAFVEAAAGRRVARAQGAVWIVSYGLYLPYTVTYVVYDLLPAVFPGVVPHRRLLEVAVPLAVSAVAMMHVRAMLLVAAALAAGQTVVVLALLAAGRHSVGAPGAALAVHGGTGTLVHGSLNVSLLFVCSSLPLFLGGEVRAGSRTVQRGLLLGFGAAAAAVLVGSLVWANAAPGASAGEIPGVTLGRATWGHGFADLVGLGVVVSTAGVMLAEFVALARLLHAMSGHPIRTANRLVASGFMAASLLSLINPDAFYRDLVKPSLVALWVSQLLVVLVYPRWAARERRPLAGAVALGAGASALMGYGLYSALTLVSGA